MITFKLASAQEQQTKGETGLTTKVGVKGGLNLAKFKENMRDENFKIGFNFGLFAKMPVSRGFSIQPELLYSSKGSTLKYDGDFGKGEYRVNLNYVEIPVMGVLNISKNFNLQAGGYVGYLAKGNVKDMKDDGTVENAVDLKAENFNRFDYGLVGGLGVDIQTFTVGARYDYGLKEIGDNSSLSGQLTGNSKNNVVTFYIGFGF